MRKDKIFWVCVALSLISLVFLSNKFLSLNTSVFTEEYKSVCKCELGDIKIVKLRDELLGCVEIEYNLRKSNNSIKNYTKEVHLKIEDPTCN